MIELIEDVRGLLDALGAERAVLVGHDWGARIAWHTAQRHPERIIALAALGVPPTPREPQRPTDMIRRFAAGAFNFALYFNSQESLRPNSRPIPAIRCAASSTRSPETRRPNSFRTCLQPNPQTVEH
jgi:pimeloyl-ACP methyl ester carboxylesterase